MRRFPFLHTLLHALDRPSPTDREAAERLDAWLDAQMTSSTSTAAATPAVEPGLAKATRQLHEMSARADAHEPQLTDERTRQRIWEEIMMSTTRANARSAIRSARSAVQPDSQRRSCRSPLLLPMKSTKWGPAVNGVATIVLLVALAAGFLSVQRRTASPGQPTQMAFSIPPSVSGSPTPGAPTAVGASTPASHVYGECAGTPFTHTLPPPVSSSPNGFKAKDWISGDGIMVGLRMDYLGEWIEGTNSVFFWSKEGGRIDATAKRTDIPAVKPITLEQFAMAPNDVAGAMWSFPTPGCWDVMLAIGSRTLRFTAKVMPEDQHAGKAAAIARRGANTPDPVPDACPVSTWDGPRRTGQGVDYQFYVDGNGVALQSSDTIYAAGENDLRWLTRSDQELMLTGVRLDAPGTIENVVPYEMLPGNGYPDYWMTSLTFPQAGCWQLTATAGDTRLTATIYVYPKRKNPPA